MICKECNGKLQERGVLNNDQLCEDCRKFVEQIVESEVERIISASKVETPSFRELVKA